MSARGPLNCSSARRSPVGRAAGAQAAAGRLRVGGGVNAPFGDPLQLGPATYFPALSSVLLLNIITANEGGLAAAAATAAPLPALAKIGFGELQERAQSIQLQPVCPVTASPLWADAGCRRRGPESQEYGQRPAARTP